ncbi:MAG: hypothetical protein Q7S00_01070, partial [bacterium]|nr:hypothetical protein [bacterium]
MAQKPKYRLQPLLTYKVRMKKKAELALARAIRRLEKEKEKLKKLEEEKEEIIRKRKERRQELHKRVGSGVSAVRDSTVHINYLRRLEEEEKEKEK